MLVFLTAGAVTCAAGMPIACKGLLEGLYALWGSVCRTTSSSSMPYSKHSAWNSSSAVSTGKTFAGTGVVKQRGRPSMALLMISLCERLWVLTVLFPKRLEELVASHTDDGHGACLVCYPVLGQSSN